LELPYTTGAVIEKGGKKSYLSIVAYPGFLHWGFGGSLEVYNWRSENAKCGMLFIT